MNYSQLSMILQMRKLRPREGGGLSKGEWDILPGTLAPGFLMSFLLSMVMASVDIENKLLVEV